MKDCFIWNHSFKDYSVELELELEVYVPRFPDVDDVAEIEILTATVIEDVADYKKGQPFNIGLLDTRKISDDYLGNEYYKQI